MKKTYMAPNISIVLVETTAMLAGSGGDETLRKYQGDELTENVQIGMGDATSESIFDRGQGEDGTGNRAKGDNGLWDNGDW